MYGCIYLGKVVYNLKGWCALLGRWTVYNTHYFLSCVNYWMCVTSYSMQCKLINIPMAQFSNCQNENNKVVIKINYVNMCKLFRGMLNT